MNIGILGTGSVGSTIGTRLIELGHTVKMGSRKAGNEKAAAWTNKNNTNASQGTFEEAASFGEMVILCLKGDGAIAALDLAGISNFRGKTVIDITNPLDASQGMPPTLFVGITDSLGEQIQKHLPEAHVVKTLNIVTADVMVNPALLNAEVDMLLCGNDESAKAGTIELLREFGWKTIIDLGGIQSARNMETFVLLWVNLYMKFNDPYFGVKFVRK